MLYEIRTEELVFMVLYALSHHLYITASGGGRYTQ